MEIVYGVAAFVLFIILGFAVIGLILPWVAFGLENYFDWVRERFKK